MAASNPHTGVITKVALGMEIVLEKPKYQLRNPLLLAGNKESLLNSRILQRRCIQICSRCMHCGQDGENIDHLFMHCSTTKNLWHMVSCILENILGYVQFY